MLGHPCARGRICHSAVAVRAGLKDKGCGDRGTERKWPGSRTQGKTERGPWGLSGSGELSPRAEAWHRTGRPWRGLGKPCSCPVVCETGHPRHTEPCPQPPGPPGLGSLSEFGASCCPHYDTPWHHPRSVPAGRDGEKREVSMGKAGWDTDWAQTRRARGHACNSSLERQSKARNLRGPKAGPKESPSTTKQSSGPTGCPALRTHVTRM